MKKSSGSPTRMRIRETDTAVRPVPARYGKRPRSITGYLTAVAAIAILALIVLPCQYRTCGGDRNHGGYAYRWIVPGIPSGEEMRPVYAARRPVPQRTIIPAGRPERKDTGGTNEGDTVKPPAKPKVYDFGTKLELITEPETR